eukprot:Trichotokara_eunicae@DN2392_c0_g1_i1.p1
MKVRAHQLRTKGVDELYSQLENLRKELSSLRVAEVSGSQKVVRIRPVRKAIARVMTVIAEKRKKEAMAKVQAEGKKIPRNARPKLTRAIRRHLTKAEMSRVTTKMQKRLEKFPVNRRYALALSIPPPEATARPVKEKNEKNEKKVKKTAKK